MEYRRLGSSGLQVSALSFGAWVTFADQIGDDAAFECMSEARRHGVNFFDNAEVYADGHAEEMMGRVICKAGWKRSDLVISTKIFWGGEGPNDKGLTRKHIVEGVQASLGRLQLDYVDLLFCHRPDSHTPIEETVRAMNHILDRGWAFYWGTSEWSASQIMAAFAVARREHLVPPQMEQPQYNMFHRHRVESEYAALYDDIGLGLTTWSPLASGLLTGKYNDGVPTETRATLPGYEWLSSRFSDDEARHQIEKIRRLDPVARSVGCTMAQLALAWCLKNPRVSTVITGASRPEQVRENMQAVDAAARLTPAMMDQIEGVLSNRPRPEIDFRSW
jgi:voltage-dependent potassium channel beta subunit